MRYVAALLLLLLLFLVGCDLVDQVVDRPIKIERPTVNLPIELRQRNWQGNRGQGSCVWATTVSLLRWQGQNQLANKIKSYGDGAGWDMLAKVADREGIRYAFITNGDVNFLEWSLKTRRGCGIVWGYNPKTNYGNHFITLVYLDAKYACVLDNNDTQNYHWMPREKLIAEWKKCGGWAFAVVYSPLPPLPQELR